MNAPLPPAAEIPAFLLRQEPPARYALWNSGHLLIVKGDQKVSLSRDDLAELRRYFDLFDKEAG